MWKNKTTMGMPTRDNHATALFIIIKNELTFNILII